MRDLTRATRTENHKASDQFRSGSRYTFCFTLTSRFGSKPRRLDRRLDAGVFLYRIRKYCLILTAKVT